MSDDNKQSEHEHASYTLGLRDLAGQGHVEPKVAAVIRDAADLIDRLAALAATPGADDDR